jgi:hypothetical protein
MIGLSTAAATVIALLLAGVARALLRRRRFGGRSPFAVHPLGGIGGRALASHVQALSDLGMYLEPPPARR